MSHTFPAHARRRRQRLDYLYSSPKGGYRADFPSPPKLLPPDPNSFLPGETVGAGSKEGIITVSFGDCNGKDAPKVIDPEKLLSVMESGLTRRPNSKVLQRDAFKLQGCPGRHVVMQEPNVYMDTYAIVRDRRVYFLIAMSKDPQWLQKPAVRHFFSSFRLEAMR